MHTSLEQQLTIIFTCMDIKEVVLRIITIMFILTVASLIFISMLDNKVIMQQPWALQSLVV
jgi:hypothetical protein